ncbi:MAG: hypothetical protein GX491_11445 [Chloroflexi bacterium]|nr:hypothetical protein [Chloroflexota bacterium]
MVSPKNKKSFIPSGTKGLFLRGTTLLPAAACSRRLCQLAISGETRPGLISLLAQTFHPSGLSGSNLRTAGEFSLGASRAPRRARTSLSRLAGE